MDIFDKAKETLAKTGSAALSITQEVTERARSKTMEWVDDEKIASMVIAATTKQEKVNKILEERGAAYRLGELTLEIGIPPSISFSVKRIPVPDSTESPQLPAPDES